MLQKEHGAATCSWTLEPGKGGWFESLSCVFIYVQWIACEWRWRAGPAVIDNSQLSIDRKPRAYALPLWALCDSTTHWLFSPLLSPTSPLSTTYSLSHFIYVLYEKLQNQLLIFSVKEWYQWLYCDSSSGAIFSMCSAFICCEKGNEVHPNTSRTCPRRSRIQRYPWSETIWISLSVILVQFEKTVF